MPALHPVVPTFALGGQSFPVAAWFAWKLQNGRTVYKGREYLTNNVNGNGYYANDTVGRYLWEFRLTGGNPAIVNRTIEVHRSTFLWEANQFLADPLAWEAHENNRIREANLGGGLAHLVGGAIHSIGNVLSDVVEFGIEVNLAALHPLTVNSNGLQLSNEATGALSAVGASESLIDAAQLVTSIGGYGVLAAAGVTALGGIGGVVDGVQSVAGVVSGATSIVSGGLAAAGALGLVPTPTPILDNATATAAANFQRPANVGALALVALVALFALGRK